MDLTITLLDRLTLQVQGNSYDGVDFNKLFLGIDFSNDEISLQSYKNIARILNTATKNETIDKTDMLVSFCLLTKQTLVSNGLADVKISYIHKTPEQVVENATTYYSDKDHTINLFFEDVLDEVVLKKLNAPIAPLARVVEIVRQINLMRQEVQTAQQFELFRVFAKNPNLTPPNVYISQKQYLATVLSKKKGKYLSYDLLAKTSAGNGLNYGDFSKYGVVSFSGINDSEQEWSHLTNPKQAVISASFMAGVVLCDVLKKLSKEDREVFAKEYPLIFLSFNSDGTRKTLIEIEKDRDQKLKNILNIKDKKQQDLEKKAVSLLYEAIIESDAILSLERCLMHITNLSWESERYFVPKNEDNKYSPTSIREEMKLASEKAQAILSIIEGDGAEFIEPILKTFEKNILDLLKDKNSDKTFLDDKKHYMFAISNLYFKNDDLKAGPKDKVLASEDKRKEIDRAVKTLKIVFPSLLPNPTVFGVSKEGKYIELPNIEERIMLDIAWEDYRTAYITKKDEDPDLLGVEPIDLQRAIRLVYPYNEYSFEDRNAVEEKIKEGELSLIPNLYEVVTEEDFYGDEMEDEEMIVDTDDEMDYNRFFLVKDKEEGEVVKETSKEVVEEKPQETKIVEEKPEPAIEEPVKENKQPTKDNKQLKKLAENVGKVIDKKTKSAISSIEEVVSMKEKKKEENKKAPKNVKSGKNVNQQFAEFEKVLDDIKEEQQPQKEETVAKDDVVERSETEKIELKEEKVEVKEEKTEEVKEEVVVPEATEMVVVEDKKEKIETELKTKTEEKDKKTTKPDDDDGTDLGKKEETPKEDKKKDSSKLAEELKEETKDKEEKSSKPIEVSEKKENRKPKYNVTKEQLDEGDKLTGEELLEKYFKFREEKEKEDAEKERIRAEAAARGEPYKDGEEVKIPVEPTKEDVYASAIEIEDIDTDKKDN